MTIAQTYTLSHDQAHLEVVPGRGGIITRWQVAGQDLLYLDQERFADPSLSVRGGIPILFPICGNLPNNEFHHQGQVYFLKQHGFARDQAWEVNQQTANSLTLSLSHHPATLSQYPFPFSLKLIYTLTANSLTLATTLHNPGPTDLPFSFGFHPYFQIANKSALELAIPATTVTDQKKQITTPFTGKFDWTAPELDLAFRPLAQPQAQMTNTATDTSLTLDFSPDYSTLVFWTIAGKDYVCVEPWTAPRNALNTGEDLLKVSPGGAWQGEFKLTVTPNSSGVIHSYK